jgi:TetR/AcrR family transcriptional regulator
MAETTRGRPRAEPRHEQEQRILRAARAAFTEPGYEAVTMSGIARDAGVPRAVVYELVGSKEMLLAAVADQVADEMIEAVDTRFSQPEELDRPLDELVPEDIRWFIELVSSDPAYPIVMRQVGRLALHDADPAARARRRIEDRIAALHVERGRTLGVERAETARVLSVVVLALLEGVAVRIDEPGWPADAVAELVGEFVAGGYLRTELGGASATFEERMSGD